MLQGKPGRSHVYQHTKQIQVLHGALEFLLQGGVLTPQRSQRIDFALQRRDLPLSSVQIGTQLRKIRGLRPNAYEPGGENAQRENHQQARAPPEQGAKQPAEAARFHRLHFKGAFLRLADFRRRGRLYWRRSDHLLEFRRFRLFLDGSDSLP